MSEVEENGVTAEVDGVAFKIFICLVQVSGDNLGLNRILGFVESFTAHFPCWLCKVKRDEFAQHLVKSATDLGTAETYDKKICR